MPTERPATRDELEAAELAKAHTLQQWMKSFIAFPSSNNRQGVIDRMTAYQDAYMNGRVRPPLD